MRNSPRDLRNVDITFGINAVVASFARPSVHSEGQTKVCSQKAPISGVILNLCGGTVAFSPATILDRLDRTWRV
jgi:hypothetical protein